jgi:hypothetical protein
MGNPKSRGRSMFVAFVLKESARQGSYLPSLEVGHQVVLLYAMELSLRSWHCSQIHVPTSSLSFDRLDSAALKQRGVGSRVTSHYGLQQHNVVIKLSIANNVC